MDRDTTSIGGLEHPPQPTRQLLYATILLDITGLGLSLLVSKYFFIGIALYVLASKAYSWRKIRLKKYPITGYLTVMIFQGALVYYLSRHGSSISKTLSLPVIPMIASALLVGSFYPLTQVYQHEADRADGVRSLSLALGYRGSFVFTAIVFFLAMAFLGYYFASNLELDRFFLIQAWLFPVLLYFLWWGYRVWRDPSHASFRNTMRMNVLASICTNAAFIHVCLIERFE
jgi:1,4-dihydroxy-2-naphthoate octaprenyltransferase